jgi:hypothetical protein
MRPHVWSETQFINIINSYIMAYLGIIEPLVIEAGHQYFIGIEISEQEIDRFPLTASPYSIGNIRTLNNMNGDIRITGGNGIGITNNDGEILIELSEQWIIHDKNNESNEFIQIIKELKQEIEYLKRQNLEMRLKIEQIENRVKSPLQKSKTDASTSLPYE